MKANKEETTVWILEKGIQQEWTKVQMENIVFPKWSDIGLLGMMFRQCLKTKEQPEGCLYDEARFQPVLRVINGKVLMTGGRPDAYTWKFSKVESAKDVQIIGANSANGLINLCNVLEEIRDIEEKKLVADMFANLKKDMLLVTTPAEKRRCIEITPELYYAGIEFCVDEWMETDADGFAEATMLTVGDYLVVTEEGVYCIRRDEFRETHMLG